MGPTRARITSSQGRRSQLRFLGRFDFQKVQQQQQQVHGPWQSRGCREQPSPSAVLLVLSRCPVCTHTENKPQPCMVPFVPWSGSFPAAWSKGGAKAEFSTSSSSTQGQTSSPSDKHAPGAWSPPSTHSCSQIRQPSLKPNLEPKLHVSCASHQQSRPLPSPSTLLCLPETTDRVNCAEEASKSMPCPQLFSRTAESDLQRPRAA